MITSPPPPRYGSATFLSVDDGDGDLYNASLVLEGRQLLEMDGTEGVLVGGSPEHVGTTVLKVHNDFREGRKCEYWKESIKKSRLCKVVQCWKNLLGRVKMSGTRTADSF